MTDEPLLPTPKAGEPGWKVKPEHRAGRRAYIDGVNKTWGMQQAVEAISASSQGSEGSTSPSKPTDTDAWDRSSTTEPVQTSWPDGGPTSPDGEMSTGSELLATPQAHDAAKGDPKRVGRFGTTHGGRNLTDDMALLAGSPLLPTPNAGTTPNGHGRRGGARGNGHQSGADLEALISSSAATPASRSATPDGEGVRPTPATYGPSSPVCLASYDPDSHCWRTFGVTFPWGSDEFSQTFPTSGMTRRGLLYALPMSGLPTAGSGSSALLPTPDTVSHDANRAPRAAANFDTNHAVSLGHRLQNLGGGTHGETVTEGADSAPPSLLPTQSLVRSLGDLTDPPSNAGSA